jgi:DNA-binding response OmpR family regulator
VPFLITDQPGEDERVERILLVEDDPIFSETLNYNLQHQGYETITTDNGLTGLELARSVHPDLVLLDVMLPGLDGFSLCRMLRSESSVPIVMLTARHDELDRITGFQVGADDYVTKPFSLGELLARIQVNLRRRVREPIELQHEVLTAGELRIDMGSRQAYRGRRTLSLTQKEFELLACLARNRGLVLSRDLLLERVWGKGPAGDARTVDVHIRWLRQKIETDPSQPCYIQTVRGIGYRLEVPVGRG